jgi:ubiquinone/menaquinone biosynthesis C-methylase UbiE
MTQREVWEHIWKEKTCGLSIEQIIERDPYYHLTLSLFPELNKLNKREIYMAEIGCGSGIRSLAICNYFKNVNLHIFLIDFSPSSIRYAIQNAKLNKVKAEFIIADALNLPFRDRVFDIVYNEGVNEHFDGVERFRIFEEMSRVVRLGGYMIVIVPNAMNLCYRIAKKILEIQGRWRYGLEKPYTLWELKSKFRKFNIIPFKAGGISVITSILGYYK